MDSFTQFEGNLLIGIQEALNADWLTPVMKGITYFGEGGCFWIALCLVLLWCKKTRRLGMVCAFSLLFTFICCNLILKPTIGRARPWEVFEAVKPLLPHPGDASFPSGHTSNAMGPAWGMFVATLPLKSESGRSYDLVPCLGWNGIGADAKVMHRLSIALVILAVLIGISRLYLGVHYPSDVICGLLLGMMCGTVVYVIITKKKKKRGCIFGGEIEK